MSVSECPSPCKESNPCHQYGLFLTGSHLRRPCLRRPVVTGPTVGTCLGGSSIQAAVGPQQGEEEAGRKRRRHEHPDILVFTRKRQLICSQVETGSIDVGVCVRLRACVKSWPTHFSVGLPRWPSGKESVCQCRRRVFSARVGKMPWRRAWQPAPVFLPGESHGQRSLVGYSPWGRTESDTTE